jgi:uncharacterized RDD family membrane protein YckC
VTASDRPAGIVTRILAALIDGVVVAALTGTVLGAVVAGLFVVNPVSFRWPHGLLAEASLVTVGVAVGYLTVGWAIAGRTVGGAVLGVRVVANGGGRLGWTRSACRALLCVLVPLGLLWAAVSARRRSVQDLVVRSTVLYDVPKVPAPRAPAAR